MKYMWEVTLQHHKNDSETVRMYGVAANINIAISKAKKKYKELNDIKSESDDLVVLNVNLLHPIEF